MKRVDDVEEREDGLKVTKGESYGGDEETVYEHPSYGMVSFHRYTVGGYGRDGGRRQGVHLFGSSIKYHDTGVRLKVSTARRHHNLSRDWYYNKNDTVIEVDLSPAQFADLITSLNAGSGVPCTIRYVDGRKIPDPPEDTQIEADKVRTDFRKKCKDAVADAKKARQEVAEFLEQKKVPKSTAETVLGKFDRLIAEVSRNMPFVLDQFEEAAEKVVTAAKAEMDATVSTLLTREGLEAALKRMDEGAQPPQLPPAPDEEG